MKPARLSPQARRDALDAMRWIMADEPIAARAFRTAIHKATILLADYPLAGGERRELADPPVRFLSLTDFPYLLVYDSAVVPPLILRILHGARDLPELLAALD
ncbi:type II toxin-antitoxin system RelE/ParE family toxin [Candidatus Magnetaquicoccus inordinatus]|uniref:type II toxin-antitoxin system RelE/ParE family toxin n=1 Tax=Candidatus Magnetaquicoccus inordinatus TaxID=2496818 RepID=UPI00102C6B53|nr:type II toxin-antitoxin system RelE/ParE family toxin [Candidatus Magnetaquicoccus inordinatus]